MEKEIGMGIGMGQGDGDGDGCSQRMMAKIDDGGADDGDGLPLLWR